MFIKSLTIKNYRSFDVQGQTIKFPTSHSALVGKNNSGKSNILKAMNLILGSKNPAYIKFEEEEYFDTTKPIEVTLVISDIVDTDKSSLFSIPNLTKAQQGALSKKIADGTAEIEFLLRRSYEYVPMDQDENVEGTQDSFEIKLWGFNVFRKREDVRTTIAKMLLVPAIRNYEDDLVSSKWTSYGQLMKEVMENASEYKDIKNILSDLNLKIQEVFKNEKERLLIGARVVSYVDDIEFQLTKDNNPSELLRNLEIFVKEKSKLFNIEYVGTGTQSAIIIGILELALRNKYSKLKLFGIEEPEAFIHPHGIRYLGSLIKNISRTQNTQVIISTHSLSLTSNFEPKEIVRVDKIDGKTVIRQDENLDSGLFRRFIHQDNAEIFFSNRILLVEGATEKQLLCLLDKATKQDSTDTNSENCNFDRINVGIIKMDSVDSIVNYIKIAKAFEISFSAILDKDFIDDASKQNICKKLCSEIGVTFQTTNKQQLINDFKQKKIFINSKGEIEDVFTNNDISLISGKTVSDIQTIKARHSKTSKAFKEIFGLSKPEYALLIADYYIQNKKQHPLEGVIRNIYLDQELQI